ncbi:MAG: ABC transporter permease [Candidatus Thermoplasmatota archaeon]
MNKELSYVLRRLLVFFIGIMVILTVEFVILRVLPGDPMSLATPRNPMVPVEYWEETRSIFEEPLYAQYVQFIGDMLTGDFRVSYLYGTDVSDIIYDDMWGTLALFSAMLAACLIVGVLFAFLVSRLRGHTARQMLSLFPLAMFALPVLGWAWVLTSAFAVQTDLLPIGGPVPPGMTRDDPAYLSEYLKHLILPVSSLTLGSLGVFALAIRDGQVRAAPTSGSGGPKLRDGLFVAMPTIQYLVAASMCFVVGVEVFFSFRGLGYLLVQSIASYDYFAMQASVFLLSLIVFLTNYALETVVTIARPGRRLDLYLREDGAAPGDAGPAPAHASHPGAVKDAVKGVLRDYLRSPIGVASLLVFLGMAALAVVGPMLSSDEIVYPWLHSSTDMFLDGAAPMVAVPVAAAVFASLMGIALGTVMGLLRPYADGLVAGVMQGMVAIPMVCLAGILLLARHGTELGTDPQGYLSASLDFMVPVAALVTLSVCHGFVSARRRLAAAGRGSVLGAPPVRFGPALASWTLGALKYGAPMTAVAVFLCDFLSVTDLGSWGYSFGFAYDMSMLMTGEWDYVLMPLIGTFLLVGSMFLVLDTLDRVVRTRFAHLI